LKKEDFQLVPGVKSEPFFKTEKEYEEFRTRFKKAVKKDLDDFNRARAESELEARNHMVD